MGPLFVCHFLDSLSEISDSLFRLLLGTCLSSLLSPNLATGTHRESDSSNRYKAIAERDVSHHNRAMIVSWKHKGLRAFYETGSTKEINANHASRLRRVLIVLDKAEDSEELNLPGWRFHRLKGDLIDFWSVSISGNWRIIFRMFDDQVELVDYLDYH